MAVNCPRTARSPNPRYRALVLAAVSTTSRMARVADDCTRTRHPAQAYTLSFDHKPQFTYSVNGLPLKDAQVAFLVATQ